MHANTLIPQERTAEDSRESESFRQLLEARTGEFIEEVLAPHFGGMMNFVKEAEGKLERGQADQMKHYEGTKIHTAEL